MNTRQELDEQFLHAALKADVSAIKTYLTHQYQVAHLHHYRLPVLLQAFVYSPSLEICEMLLQAGVKNINEYLEKEEVEDRSRTLIKTTALAQAILQNNLPKVQWLLGKGADVNQPHYYQLYSFAPCKTCTPPLQLAQQAGPTEIFRLLLSSGADVNGQNEEGRTSLMVAAGNNACDVAKILLTTSIDVNAQDNNGNTALMLGIKNGHPQIVNLLLQNQTQTCIDMNAKDKNGNTALMLAIRNEQVNMVKILLQNHALVNLSDVYGQTTLKIAQAHGQQEIIRLLLSAGAKP